MSYASLLGLTGWKIMLLNSAMASFIDFYACLSN